jgi:hypothetical protein
MVTFPRAHGAALPAAVFFLVVLSAIPLDSAASEPAYGIGGLPVPSVPFPDSPAGVPLFEDRPPAEEPPPIPPPAPEALSLPADPARTGQSGVRGIGLSPSGEPRSDSLKTIDPSELLGLTLDEAYRTFGAPASVFPLRGGESWQDDVVFFYPSRLYLFWYRDRVWQVRLDSRFSGTALGCTIGMKRIEVDAVLGAPALEEAGWAVYLLPDRGYPVRARLQFTDGLLRDLYVYRADF